MEAEEEKGKNWQGATRLVKDRKAFPIWLVQPDAYKGNKRIKETEKEESIKFIRC